MLICFLDLVIPIIVLLIILGLENDKKQEKRGKSKGEIEKIDYL